MPPSGCSSVNCGVAPSLARVPGGGKERGRPIFDRAGVSSTGWHRYRKSALAQKTIIPLRRSAIKLLTATGGLRFWLPQRETLALELDCTSGTLCRAESEPANSGQMALGWPPLQCWDNRNPLLLFRLFGLPALWNNEGSIRAIPQGELRLVTS